MTVNVRLHLAHWDDHLNIFCRMHPEFYTSVNFVVQRCTKLYSVVRALKLSPKLSLLRVHLFYGSYCHPSHKLKKVATVRTMGQLI